MKHKHIFIVLLFLFFFPYFLNAQTNKPSRSESILQDIYNKIDMLEKKMDIKFEEIDKRFEQIDTRLNQIDTRLTQIDMTLVKYDERFQSIKIIFTIFGSVFGVVILIAVGIFGFYFNKLSKFHSLSSFYNNCWK